MHGSRIEAMMRQHYSHEVSPNKCSSRVTQTILAPMGLVWSIVRDFGQPQAYKRFVKKCIMRSGDGSVGSVREVHFVSGPPARVSVERLERLDDDDDRVISFSIIGGDHRLVNYRSTTSVHEEDDHDDDDDDA